MPQNTNLNINPYYEDFDASKNYNRVLFKPGIPIQARELTSLQSVLQNQIEKFGQHFFKEGSVVIPGSLTYDNQFYAVKIEPTFFGVSVETYYDQLVGLTIQGKTSGITAVVKKVLSRNQSIEGTTTLYIKYQNSSSQDYITEQFLDGENLVTLTNFSYGSTTIAAGSDFATCGITNAAATGCSFSISEGVFFARGAFISVDNETIVLDQYSNSPSYRVGFFVNEEIITVIDDPSLYDNAQGFSNFTAPGADRLKISLSLIKKDLSDFQDENGEWIKFTEEFGSNHFGKYKKAGKWAFPVFPSNMSLIGSVPTPYIFDDRADFRDAAKAIYDIYSLSPKERKETGKAAREWATSDEAMMTAKNMCINFIKYTDETFTKWEPRAPYDFIKIEKLPAKQNKFPVSL